MSSICKNNYNNYGSYLRSRGYNEQICNLVNDLNNGNVVLGSVVPNGTDGVTLKGTVNINNATGSNGYLVVNGGDNTNRDLFSIQANNGMKLAGPIVQTASNVNYSNDPSYNFGNVFRGNQHVFTNNDGSCNLLLNGHMYSFGSVPSVAVTTQNNGTEAIDICANSTDTAGRFYLSGGWSNTDQFTLTFSKPYTEVPVFIYSTEVGGNKSGLTKSVSTSSVVFTVTDNLSAGYISYHTIGIQE